MQRDLDHHGARKFETRNWRHAATSTCEGLITARAGFDDESFAYVEVTERLIHDLATRQAKRRRNYTEESPMFTEKAVRVQPLEFHLADVSTTNAGRKRSSRLNDPEPVLAGNRSYRCIANCRSDGALEKKTVRFIVQECSSSDNESVCSRETCKGELGTVDQIEDGNRVAVYKDTVQDRNADGEDFDKSFTRKSLFPNVPPYVVFHYRKWGRSKKLYKDLSRLLKWKLTSTTPEIIMNIVTRSGYQLVTEGDWSAAWNPTLGEAVNFQQIRSFQKVNSFPGSHNLGNKDQLWIHMRRMRQKYGLAEFDFVPKTYVLPGEMRKFENAWLRLGATATWILKPPCSGRGQGVKVINQWWEIPKWRSVVVQRYISTPRLINGSKFDLRIYVLVTSINPTRIYIYKDGLARFASVKYLRGSANLGERCMHLTNTSVNKRNPAYVVSASPHSCRGHKWSLGCLWSYLREDGVDVATLWDKIKDIVVKTIVAGEADLNAAILGNVASCYTCYELYGFDVLLDESCKPWLLEVNVLPSLQTDSPLDLAVKAPLVHDILNMAGYRIPNDARAPKDDAARDSMNRHDRELYGKTLSPAEKIKQGNFSSVERREEYLDGILENLTRDDLRQLIRYEDEVSQVGHFEKIFPTTSTYGYSKYFETPRYYDKLLDAWECRYCGNRKEGVGKLIKLCEEQRHLQ